MAPIPAANGDTDSRAMGECEGTKPGWYGADSGPKEGATTIGEPLDTALAWAATNGTAAQRRDCLIALAVAGSLGTPTPPLSTNLLPPLGVGTSVPWIEPWQFVQRSASGRLAPSWCPAWHCKHNAGWLTDSMPTFGEPCGEWQIRQFSFTGGCWYM